MRPERSTRRLRPMDEVIAWATFAGAWLLVAGPLYQGSVELDELDVDREGIQGKAAAAQAAQARPSAWWWLLPPVMYVLHRRWNKALRQAVLAQLTQTQRAQMASYQSKATGWFTVGGRRHPARRRGDMADRPASQVARLAVLAAGRGNAGRRGPQHRGPGEQQRTHAPRRRRRVSVRRRAALGPGASRQRPALRAASPTAPCTAAGNVTTRSSSEPARGTSPVPGTRSGCAVCAGQAGRRGVCG